MWPSFKWDLITHPDTFAYFARNARCTVTRDLFVWHSNTQNDFSPGAAIFSLHTHASPSRRNVNYDEKQLTGKFFFCSFYLYRFRKYVSYGFPIIFFCNPEVHYETPCITEYESWWYFHNRGSCWGYSYFLHLDFLVFVHSLLSTAFCKNDTSSFELYFKHS